MCSNLDKKRQRFGHFSTFPGHIKIIQLVFAFFCLCSWSISVASSRNDETKQSIFFGMMIDLVVTIIWAIVYLLQTHQLLGPRFKKCWIIMELLSTGFIASHFISCITYHVEVFGPLFSIAWFSCFLSSLAYSFGTFLLLLDLCDEYRLFKTFYLRGKAKKCFYCVFHFCFNHEGLSSHNS